MAIFRKITMLILHKINNAKIKPLSKFQQKRMIFHGDIAKTRKTKEISADGVRKTIEYTKRTKETSPFFNLGHFSHCFSLKNYE